MLCAKTVFEEILDNDEASPAVLLRGGRRARRAGLAWPQPLAGQHLHPPLTGYDH